MSDEAILMSAIVGLYLYDSALLLAINEAVIVRAGATRWLVSFGLQGYRLAGREPCLPNPFTPHRRAYRLAWSPDTLPVADPKAIAQLGAEAHHELPSLPVVCMALALLVLLPLGLFSRLGFVCILASVAIFYVSALTALTCIYRRRHDLGLSATQVASLAFQCLACPPFGLNLIRKTCALRPRPLDLAVAGACLLRPEELERMKAQCLRRLDEMIDFEPEDSERFAALSASRPRFLPKHEPT